MSKPLAGRELDRAVAVLMGDVEEWDSSDTAEGGTWWRSQDGSRISTDDGGPRHYSTEIGPAWAVVECLLVRGIQLRLMPIGYHGGWQCDRIDPGGRAKGQGATAAEAICRAALEAAAHD